MLKTRIVLIVASAIVIWLLFLLPKVVVENEGQMVEEQTSTDQKRPEDPHITAPEEVRGKIRQLRAKFQEATEKEKNAIFADSLVKLYQEAGKFDSAAWFADEAASFFNTLESWVSAGDSYYQAYTFEMDPAHQEVLAEKARDYYAKVMEADPKNLDVKSKMAMTYLTSKNPMQGIAMLREVLQDDPDNEQALFNLGMLSIQSGQHDLAVKRLQELIRVNPAHTQGRLLLGIALMNTGDRDGARQQFEKVKEMDKDPAVQATVDSYLKDLK